MVHAAVGQLAGMTAELHATADNVLAADEEGGNDRNAAFPSQPRAPSFECATADING